MNNFPPFFYEKSGKSGKPNKIHQVFDENIEINTSPQAFHILFHPCFPHYVETVDYVNKPLFIILFNVDILSTLLWITPFYQLFHKRRFSTVGYPQVFHVDKCGKLKRGVSYPIISSFSCGKLFLPFLPW